MPGIPNPTVTPVGSPASSPTDLPADRMPTLARINSLDLVGPQAANRQHKALEKRTVVLQQTVDLLVANNNVMDARYQRRDASTQQDATAGFLADVPMNNNKFTGMAAGTQPDHSVNLGQVNTAIAAEAATRLAADNAEAATRLAADNAEIAARTAAINQEVTDRNAAILVETNNRIAAVNAEAAARIAADNAEATARAAISTELHAPSMLAVYDAQTLNSFHDSNTTPSSYSNEIVVGTYGNVWEHNVISSFGNEQPGYMGAYSMVCGDPVDRSFGIVLNAIQVVWSGSNTSSNVRLIGGVSPYRAVYPGPASGLFDVLVPTNSTVTTIADPFSTGVDIIQASARQSGSDVLIKFRCWRNYNSSYLRLTLSFSVLRHRLLLKP